MVTGDPNTERTSDLATLVCGDVKARQVWADRQVTWYKMRHDGLRRSRKPWARASDVHYPLADTTIDKFKPFYAGQLFGTEVIAQFTPLQEELTGTAGECGQFFDYKLKQQSNLETEVMVCIDKMLMAGFGLMKPRWDSEKKQLAFDAFEPTHVIVPDQTMDVDGADRITFVHHYTKDGFKRDQQFKLKVAEYEQDEEGFCKRITGDGTGSTGTGNESYLRQVKELREGITHSGEDSDLIIVWEIWEQTTDDGWWIHWISPLAPDKPLRASQRNPFRHGTCPLVKFDCEIKDKSWYGSRGIPEKMVAFEASLCKMWNEKHDWMTLCNQPLFKSTSPIPNAGNFKFTPGQILPSGVDQIQMGRPPVSWDEDMNMTRAVAEQNLGVPDFGIGASNDKNDPRTATEVTRIGQQQSTGIELRSRVFRLSLRRLLKLAWETLVQYDTETTYFLGAEMKKLPNKALAPDVWGIEPNASSESWNKSMMLQRAVARLQMYGPSQGYPQGMPWINQPELSRSALELDDPKLVGRFFIDPNANARNEYEDESKSIPALLLGAPLQPRPEQDQPTRIKSILDFVQAHDQMGSPLSPQGLSALHNRVQGHLAVLKQKNPEQAQQIAMQLAQQTAKVIPMQQPQGAMQ